MFGWTADEQASFEVLDAYTNAGGNFIDTADQYSNWVPGHNGGESETVIGHWLASRGNRSQVVIATKVGAVGIGNPGGLTADSIRGRVSDSLNRLGVENIDLLYAHHDDPGTPLEETMSAFNELVAGGVVRHLGLSNFPVARLNAAFEITSQRGWAPFQVLQAHYNLLERPRYESELRQAVVAHGLTCVPYWTLAKGFLTGKYRADSSATDASFSDRTSRHHVLDYRDPRNLGIIRVLDEVASAHSTTVAAVALAWTAAQPTIQAPIASARTVEQLMGLLPMVDLVLSPQELSTLHEATTAPSGT